MQDLACQYCSQVGNGGSPAALAKRLPAIAEALLTDGEDQICITAADPCPPALLACFQVWAGCVHSSFQPLEGWVLRRLHPCGPCMGKVRLYGQGTATAEYDAKPGTCCRYEKMKLGQEGQ